VKNDDPILITGGTGVVGSRLIPQLRKLGFVRLQTPSRDELDLCDERSVQSWFDYNRPRYAFLVVAKVGGIAANMSDPTGFLEDNLKIVANQLQACHRVGVEKILLLGSTCIYPRDCPQPVHENYLLTGPLEPTNEGYALAKIIGLRLAQSYSKQYGMKSVLPMPCNIYGTNDHFDLARSHVLSALVKRFTDAMDSKDEKLTL